MTRRRMGRRRAWGRSRRFLTISFTALLLTLGLATAPATAEAATSLTLTASKGYAGTPTHLRVALADGGSPFVGTVVVQRRVDGAWTTIATPTTDAQGHATVDASLAQQSKDNVFRARYAGDGTHGAAESGRQQAQLVRRNSVVVVGGPKQVVDGRRTVVRVRWHTGVGEPVSGPVRLYQRLGDRPLEAGRHGPHQRSGNGDPPGAAAGRLAVARDRAQARLDLRRPQPRAPDRQPAARRSRCGSRAPRPGRGSACRRSAGPSATAPTPPSPASRTASGGR